MTRIIMSNGQNILCADTDILESTDHLSIKNCEFSGIKYDQIVVFKAHIAIVAHKD